MKGEESGQRYHAKDRRRRRKKSETDLEPELQIEPNKPIPIARTADQSSAVD